MEEIILSNVSSNINPNFFSDKQMLKDVFKESGVDMPRFFIKLCNNLKKLDEREWIFRYIHLYLNENYTIERIQAEIRKRKPKRRKPKLGGRRPMGRSKLIRI